MEPMEATLVLLAIVVATVGYVLVAAHSAGRYARVMGAHGDWWVAAMWPIALPCEALVHLALWAYRRGRAEPKVELPRACVINSRAEGDIIVKVGRE